MSMLGSNDKTIYFAETDFRGKKTKFGIKPEDRTRHLYVIGKTGMGKSTLLENLAIQDIQNGNGIAFMDPHGSTAEKLLDYVPENRIKDVVYFAPFDTDNPIAFNVMEDVGMDKRHLVANGLMSAFKKIWVDAWSARMEYILNNIILALLEYPNSTLLGVNRMLTDKNYRKSVVENITDPSVKLFWTDEYAKWDERYAREAGAAIQNKIGQFISNPIIRNIVGQTKSSFDMRKVMDEKKILIVNLSKGQVGESNANLLGSMLITKIYLAAMSRADVSGEERENLPNFYFFVDEFQSFANESFADILSEARKYKLNLTIAHQYIEQMPDEVRAAVFGNVGTMIIFRVGSYDAEVFEKEFSPTFYVDDIVNLGFAQIYLKLMIDGIGSSPFSATTLPPILTEGEQSFKENILENSRQTFGHPRVKVEQDIEDWHKESFIVKKERPFDGSLNSGKNKVSEKDNNHTKVQWKDRTARVPYPEKNISNNISTKVAFEKKALTESHPFKKAFNGLNNDKTNKRPVPKKQTVNLGELLSPHINSEQQKQKQVTNQNKSQLKDALNLALGGIEKKERLTKTQERFSPPSQLDKNKVKTDQQPKEQKDSSKEIPENVLRDMLKVAQEE
jgi:hypothetical protein